MCLDRTIFPPEYQLQSLLNRDTIDRRHQVNKMCVFEYKIYHICGHRFIEITNYCSKVVWAAGVIPVLKPCEETNYASFIEQSITGLQSFRQSVWKGMSGFCKKCKMDCEVSLASFISMNLIISHAECHTTCSFQYLFLDLREKRIFINTDRV